MVELTIDEKIDSRMKELEEMMSRNLHLDDPDAVTKQIRTVDKFWSRLAEEDRDYIQAVRHAIDERSQWSE